jgi:hypothetical protein
VKGTSIQRWYAKLLLGQRSVRPGKLHVSGIAVCALTASVHAVVKDGVTHMAFMPVESACVLAAADKKGYLGFWVHDPFQEDAALADLGQDGVLLTSPQRQYISGLHWMPDAPTRLVCASYDGSLVLCDPAAERFRVVRHDASEEYSSLGCRDSSCLLTGDNMVCFCSMLRNEVASILALHKRELSCCEYWT